MNDLNKEIGRRLKALRKAQDKTQQTVANDIGMAQTGYGAYETGRNGLSPDILIRLAEYFGTTCDYILRGI